MIISTFTRFGGIAALLSVATFAASAELVTNGGFDGGDLTGWTTYTTPDGTNGSGLPIVSSFDLGSGPSDAAQFNVGSPCCTPPSGPAGGGISQTITAPEDGTYLFTAQFASDNASTLKNFDAGTFSILVDGIVVATDSLGSILSGQVIDGALDGSEALTAGDHTLEVQIERVFVSESTTPQEYVDNISATETSAASPEPGTMSLLAGGVTLIGLIRRRRKLSI